MISRSGRAVGVISGISVRLGIGVTLTRVGFGRCCCRCRGEVVDFDSSHHLKDRVFVTSGVGGGVNG